MWSQIFNRLSLRSVMIINIIVPLLLAMGIAAYFGLHATESLVEKRLQEDVQLVARAVRLPVSYSLEKERFGSMAQTLESVFQIGRVYGAYVYDARGNRIAAAGAVHPEKRADDLRLVVEDGKRKGQYEKIQGEQVYSYFVPLFDSTGRSSGLLQVIRKKSDFEDYIAGLRIRTAAILFGTALFVSGLVLFGFHGAAGRYFATLAQSMARIQAGDRSHRAGVDGPREIASLAKALNAMLAEMDRSEKEIEKRRAEQQVLESKVRENEKMAAVGRLAAGVAHELGAPLSLIDGRAQRSQRDAKIGETHRNSLDDIRKQVRRMSDIVQQLLAFGKGAMQQKRWIHAARLAGSAVATIQKEMGTRLDVVMEGPDPGPRLFVDPLRMEQALVNLLRNAAQAEKASRVGLNWRLGPEKEVIFTIEDDGTGIDDDIKSKIFEPFFSTRKNDRNTGMGLSVVHGIVQEHGGSIQVFDAGSGGAGFSIAIPRQTESKRLDRGEGNA